MNPRIQARIKRRNRRCERDRFLGRMRALMPDYDLMGFEFGCPVWVTKEPTGGGHYGMAFGWPMKPVMVTVTREPDPVTESAEVAL